MVGPAIGALNALSIRWGKSCSAKITDIRDELSIARAARETGGKAESTDTRNTLRGVDRPSISVVDSIAIDDLIENWP